MIRLISFSEVAKVSTTMLRTFQISMQDKNHQLTRFLWYLVYMASGLLISLVHFYQNAILNLRMDLYVIFRII